MPSNIELQRIVNDVMLSNLDKSAPLGWDEDYNRKSRKTTTDARNKSKSLEESFSSDPHDPFECY